jgi:hypothetical protein
MEAAEVVRNVDGVLRLTEKNRESILVLKDGRPHCRIEPRHRVGLETLQVLRRRESRKLHKARS